MVTPERLEDKIHTLSQQMETNAERETNKLENLVHIKAKEITDHCTHLIRERVGKKDFNDQQSLLLNLIREGKTQNKHSDVQLEALQTKYENLDTFYVTVEQMDSFKDRMNSLENELREKIEEIEKAFSENSEDEDSQMNESIEGVSGEINDVDSYHSKQRSNRGRKPNVGTLEVNDGDVMSVPQSGRNSNMEQSATVMRRETDDVVYPLSKEDGELNPSPIKGVVTTTKVIGMGGTTRQIIAGNSQVLVADQQSVKGDGAESSVHGKSQTKSQKSRFSLKSRKAGGMSKQQVEELQAEMKLAVKEVQDKLDLLVERHELGWDLVTINREIATKVFEGYRKEEGFVGVRRYNLQELDHTMNKFNEMNKLVLRKDEDANSKIEALDADYVALDRKHEKVAKVVKQLHDERTDNVNFADRKI